MVANHTLFANTEAAGYVHTNGKFNAGARFRFLNLPEFLERPGQFWYSEATGYMYVVGAGERGQSCTLAAGPTALQVANTR